MTSDPHKAPQEDPVRQHVYDGIAEYDRRLPNWWLATFYITIVFSIVYWFVTQLSAHATDAVRLEKSLAQLEAARLADAGAPRDDASLWKMSRNDVFVNAGRSAYMTTCASCHGPSLKGGVGPNLVDEAWLHGGNPTQVLATVEKGVLAKGMPAWGPVLGARRVNELVAYILSQHTPPAAAIP